MSLTPQVSALVAAMVFWPAAHPLAAQTPPSSPPPPRALWTISGYLGGGGGGPGPSMASHLERVGGFEATSVCFYVGCPDFPRYHPPAEQWSVALGHTLGRRMGVRAMVGAGSFGWASGEGTSGSITRHWAATTVSAHLTYELPPTQWLKEAAFGASFGAGPVLAWVQSSRGVPDAYPADSSSEVTRLGVELRAAGTMWPGKHRWVFFGLEAGYRFLPGRTEGPYALDTGSGSLASFDVAYRHFTLGVVAGVRFPFP